MQTTPITEGDTRRRARRGLAIYFAVVLALSAPIEGYVIAWVSGLAGFDGLPSASFIVPFAVGMVVGLVLAAGEEIGWRGYMLTRLIDAGVPRPVFASGLIWALWHVPLVLGGAYAAGPSPALSAGLIVVSITSFGYV